MRKIVRYAGTELSRLGQRWVRFKRCKIERAQAHAEFDSVSTRPDPGNDLAQYPGPIFKGSTILTRPREGAQKFVQQITVAMLDIYKISPHIPGDFRRVHVIFNQPFNFGIRPDL